MPAAVSPRGTSISSSRTPSPISKSGYVKCDGQVHRAWHGSGLRLFSRHKISGWRKLADTAAVADLNGGVTRYCGRELSVGKLPSAAVTANLNGMAIPVRLCLTHEDGYRSVLRA